MTFDPHSVFSTAKAPWCVEQGAVCSVWLAAVPMPTGAVHYVTAPVHFLGCWQHHVTCGTKSREQWGLPTPESNWPQWLWGQHVFLNQRWAFGHMDVQRFESVAVAYGRWWWTEAADLEYHWRAG